MVRNTQAMQEHPLAVHFVVGAGRVKQCAEVVLLGFGLSPSASSQCMEMHRAVQAKKVWHASQGLLRDQNIDVTKRIKKFYETVVACLLFGSPAWTPTRRLHLWLDAFETRYLRMVCCRRRPPEEPWQTVASPHRQNSPGGATVCQLRAHLDLVSAGLRGLARPRGETK
jgi:hypothetical protein